MVKIKGGIAVLLSKHSGDCSILEPIVKEGPLVTESDHILDTFFTLPLEQCGGVQHQCIAQTDCCLLFLRWEKGGQGW